MTADVEPLRERLQDYADGLGAPPVILHDVGELVTLLREADAEIEALRAEVVELRERDIRWQKIANAARMADMRSERLAEALRWYAEQAAGCRKLGRDGDAARTALDADGGRRARAALEQENER